MATFTAYQAFDMRDVYDEPIIVASLDVVFHQWGAYTDVNANQRIIFGTDVGFADGRPTATTMSSVTQRFEGNDWWNISGTDFHDPTFTGYTDGYDYGGNVGVLYGMEAEVAWWLRFNDTINGSAENDFLRGYDGNDVINGNDGHDSLAGNRGNDTVDGGNGDDILNGGGGSNTIIGGTGDDTLRYDWASFGANVDLRLSTAQGTGVSTDTISGIENIIGSAYKDRLDGDGGDNYLFGGDGKDRLSGNGGDDSLYGGKGVDVLKGGGGSDKFVFDTKLSGNNIDTIKEFSVGSDLIVLTRQVFRKIAESGELSPLNFVADETGLAKDSNDYIVYETDTGALFYDADGNGAGAAVQFAQIGTSTHPMLTVSDFLVY